MFTGICNLTVFVLMVVSTSAFAEAAYSVHDIGTLQTRESTAIAINNRNQILGWYNVDGSNEGKHFFVRYMNVAHELQGKDTKTGLPIQWEYLTNLGMVYGYVDVSASVRDLYMWNESNGVVCLGSLPGKEIVSINDMGQVLIKAVATSKDGKSVRHPAIWHHGKVTVLPALSGNLGIEAEEAYGLSMNNVGVVVGESLVWVNYKNKLYSQKHAVKWVLGKLSDLQSVINEKSLNSRASLVNDRCEVYITAVHPYLLDLRNKAIAMPDEDPLTKINNNYLYNQTSVFKTNGTLHMKLETMNEKLSRDFDTIFLKIDQIVGVNDKGNIVAQSTTIYGEKHIVLLTPKK